METSVEELKVILGHFASLSRLRVALGFVTSNLTSKSMDTDTSPALIRAVFGLQKKHCLYSETATKLPQASKQSF